MIFSSNDAVDIQVAKGPALDRIAASMDIKRRTWFYGFFKESDKKLRRRVSFAIGCYEVIQSMVAGTHDGSPLRVEDIHAKMAVSSYREVPRKRLKWLLWKLFG